MTEIHKDKVTAEEWQKALDELKVERYKYQVKDRPRPWYRWENDEDDIWFLENDKIVIIHKAPQLEGEYLTRARAEANAGKEELARLRAISNAKEYIDIKQITDNPEVMAAFKPFSAEDKALFEKIDKIGEEFWSAVSKCKVAEDEVEQARRQAGNLDGILAERGAVYGDYGIHVKAVATIMDELEMVCTLRDGNPMPSKNRAMNFYIVSKLVRLAATPDHEDSLKDAINYLKLMYKEIHGVEIQ